MAATVLLTTVPASTPKARLASVRAGRTIGLARKKPACHLLSMPSTSNLPAYHVSSTPTAQARTAETTPRNRALIRANRVRPGEPEGAGLEPPGDERCAREGPDDRRKR